MAIKNQSALSKEDFETALVTLRLSVSEVSRESGIPRHQLSHFRNYGDGLKPEQAAKLRDYLEDKGIEFTEEAEHIPEASTHDHQVEHVPADPIQLPFTLADDGFTRRTLIACRHFFVDDRLSDEQLAECGRRFEQCYDNAYSLMNQELKREAGFLGLGEETDKLSEETEQKLRDLWGQLAGLGVLALHMQGRLVVNAIPTGENPKTLGDFLSVQYRGLMEGISEDTAQSEEATEDGGQDDEQQEEEAA